MLSFSDALFNADYAKQYARMNGFERMVFLENESDKAFWSQLFADANLTGCDFGYFCGEKSDTRGKSQYKPYLLKANRYAMIAIDSDYDYLAPNHGDCDLANGCSPFVLQTYAYARENIISNHLSVDYALNQIHFTVNEPTDFVQFTQQFSQAVYPLLIVFLFCLERFGDKPQWFSKDAFKQFLASQKFDKAYFQPERWPLITESITNKVSDLEQALANELEQFNGQFRDFTQQLNSKGVMENNAYRFIDGHFWHETVVEPIVKKRISSLKEKELQRIREQFKGKQIENRTKEMHNHFNHKCSFDTLIHQPFLFQQDVFYQQLLAKIKAY